MSKKTNNQTPVNEVVEAKVEVAPKFDKQAFIKSIQESFKSDTLELVADSELEDGPRATNEADWRYVHIFKKGTTKNCYQLYLDSKKGTFVVGKALHEIMAAEGYTVAESFTAEIKPVMKKEKLAYYIYKVDHSQILTTLGMLEQVYILSQSKKAEAVRKTEEVEAEKPKKEKKSKKEKTVA